MEWGRNGKKTSLYKSRLASIRAFLDKYLNAISFIWFNISCPALAEHISCSCCIRYSEENYVDNCAEYKLSSKYTYITYPFKYL